MAFITDIDPSSPAFNGPAGEGDDQIRSFKGDVQGSFPNIAGAVSATDVELSFVTGVTSSIQTQITNLTSNVIEAGSAVIFVQGAAPTGWTKSVTHDNKALRIVSGGTGGGGAGSINFDTVFGAATATTEDTHNHVITIAQHLLTAAQSGLPGHLHAVTTSNDGTTSGNNVEGSNGAPVGVGTTQSIVGQNAASSHGHSGSSSANDVHSHTSNLSVKYVDSIICIKDAF